MTDDLSDAAPQAEAGDGGLIPQGQPLQYAPPARGAVGGRTAAVLAGGLLTSALAAAGVYLLQRYKHEDPFAWHVLLLAPVGSLLMAIAAGSGYAVAARLGHVRGGRRLRFVVAMLMMAAYVGCLYAGFGPFRWVNRHTGVPLTFPQFVDDRSVHWVWRWGGDRIELGRAGYLYRVLDVTIFAVVGGVAASFGSGADYCDLCQTYRTRRRLAVFPASLPYRKLGGLSAEDLAAYQADQLEQTQSAVDAAGHLMTLATADDADSLQQVIDAVRPERRQADRLPTRLELHLSACPVCRATTLRTVLRIGRTRRTLDTQPVSGAFADLQ